MKNICDCCIYPALDTSKMVLILLGVCVVVDLLRWQNVEFLFYAFVFSMLVIYGHIFYLVIKGTRKVLPHHPSCPQSSLTNNQRS